MNCGPMKDVESASTMSLKLLRIGINVLFYVRFFNFVAQMDAAVRDIKE